MALAPFAAAAHPATQFVEGEVLVTFKQAENLEAAKTTLGKHALKFDQHFAALSAHRGRHTGLLREKTRTTAQLIAIPFLLYDGLLFNVINCRTTGRVLIWVAAILTLWSMFYYLKAAFPSQPAK